MILGKLTFYINRMGGSKSDERYRFYWREIHDFAGSCNTIAERRAFSVWISNLSKRFFCDKCRVHFNKYLLNNPVDESPDPVEWAWRFHNAVNDRLGKKNLSVVEALSATGREEKCDSCGI